MTRLYQDYNFNVVEVAGETAARLLACVNDGDEDAAPIVVSLQLASSTAWHRFFLQAQIGFWELYDAAVIEEEFADFQGDTVHLVDYSRFVGGLPRRINKAVAWETGTKALTNIEVEFDSGISMRLAPDSAEIDTKFHIEFVVTPSA